MRVLGSRSEDETFAIGETMGKTIKPGSVIALMGDLGVGKTVFTKGFAKGLGIEENVSSPTFNILKSYRGGRLTLHHFDVYRIGDSSEMDEIGYEDCFFGEDVSLVEWADIIDDILPPDTIKITIKKNPAEGFDFREIIIDDDTGH